LLIWVWHRNKSRFDGYLEHPSLQWDNEVEDKATCQCNIACEGMISVWIHSQHFFCRNPFAEVEQKRLQHGVLVLEDCFGLGFATCALIGRTGMSVECLVSGRRTSVALCDMVPGGSLHSTVDEQAAI